MALSDFSDDSGGEYFFVVIGTAKPAEHTGYMGYKAPAPRARGSQSQAHGSQASEASASDDFSLVSGSRKSNVRRTRAAPSAADSMDSLPEFKHQVHVWPACGVDMP